MALTADDVRSGDWLTDSLELAREVGDDREIGAASRSLAAAMIELGDSARATSLLAESLALARELAEPHGIAVCLDAFAGLAATAGEVERAATLSARATRPVRRSVRNVSPITRFSMTAGSPERSRISTRTPTRLTTKMDER